MHLETCARDILLHLAIRGWNKHRYSRAALFDSLIWQLNGNDRSNPCSDPSLAASWFIASDVESLVALGFADTHQDAAQSAISTWITSHWVTYFCSTLLEFRCIKCRSPWAPLKSVQSAMFMLGFEFTVVVLGKHSMSEDLYPFLEVSCLEVIKKSECLFGSIWLLVDVSMG